jgi:hypothetical protein
MPTISPLCERPVNVEVTPMAKISSVNLTIIPLPAVPGQAQVRVVYTLSHSGDDEEAERGYHEVAQLLSKGSPVPNGTMFESDIRFTPDEGEIPRSREQNMAITDLRANVLPAQDASIVARVTLTPLLPSRDSNAVQVPAAGAHQ